MSFYKKPAVAVTLAAGGLLLCKYITSKLSKFSNKKCILVESVKDWNKYESEILRELKNSVVGIDCEWVTVDGQRQPVSLLQLANDSGFCVLIRLCFISVWLMPAGLTELLCDRKVLKVGVGVYDDVDKLFQDYCFEVWNFIDLRYLARDLPEMRGKSLGLKSLAKELLGLELNKSRSLRCSNWDVPELSAEQVNYASADAVISAQIYAEIKRRKCSWFSKAHFLEELDQYIDKPFKQTQIQTKTSISNSVPKSISNSLPKSGYNRPRQKPMYGNCQLLAPDGELLCICDKCKAEWYVEKGLGEVITNEPYTVRLKFEPSGRPTLDDFYYTKELSNCCVVCGVTENYHRKLVVPSEYRKYFPDLMKKNLSHDILLLCVNCHKKSNILDQKMRLKLAAKCNAPIVNERHAKYKFNPEFARVKSAAVALWRSGGNIPESRKEELKKTISDYYKIDFITEEILDEARNLDAGILNNSFKPHGLKVFQYFCKNDGLIQLEKLWRQHFLDSMQPKFLPAMWSVDHNHKRLALQALNPGYSHRKVDFDVSILGISPELMREIEQYK